MCIVWTRVCVCMCMYMYACACICVCAGVCACVCVCRHVQVCGRGMSGMHTHTVYVVGSTVRGIGLWSKRVECGNRGTKQVYAVSVGTIISFVTSLTTHTSTHTHTGTHVLNYTNSVLSMCTRHVQRHNPLTRVAPWGALWPPPLPWTRCQTAPFGGRGARPSDPGLPS